MNKTSENGVAFDDDKFVGNPLFEDADLILGENIFDDANLQNDGVEQSKQNDKEPIVQIVEQTEISKIEPENKVDDENAQNLEDVETEDENEKRDDKEQQTKEQKEERKYGKFKTPEELLHAYGELEKEFTRRSQRLKELENEKNEPFKTDEDWKAAVDKFFTETPSAKAFAKDIANEIISHPELKQNANCLNIALTRALVSKFRTPEQLMSDGQFLKDYVLCSKEVKDAVIAEYLQGIRRGEPPFTLGGGGAQLASSPKTPKTIEEAGFMFLKENK